MDTGKLMEWEYYDDVTSSRDIEIIRITNIPYIAARFDSKIKGKINSPHCVLIFFFRTAHYVYIRKEH